MNTITQEDLTLILQQSAVPQKIKIKIEVLDSNRKIVGVINNIVNCTIQIDANSDVRRTCTLSLQPDIKENISIGTDELIWINKDFRLSVGIYNPRTKQYKYYAMGYFVYVDSSKKYDAASNQYSVSCADFIKKLDGTKNGQIGAKVTSFPAYEEDDVTGEVLKYNIIREAVITILEQLCGIKNHRIDDIGEYKAMPLYNDDWQTYREENETWNAIPYDQEFSCGCSVLSILTTFRDLYPNYEMFFEPEDNTFICQMVPSCYDDEIYLDNDFLQRILISEDSSVDLSSVKNICQVRGKSIEADFYTTNCSYNNSLFSATVTAYDEYYTGDKIAIELPCANPANAKLKINRLGTLDIYNDSTEKPLEENTFEENTVGVFKIKKKKINDEYVFCAYYLGQWEINAMDVLTNGKETQETWTAPDGEAVPLYSKEYFQKKYGCENVKMTIIANSPYTVQKIGEIPDVKNGSEYENIESNSLAMDRARWENWKNCRLTDNITITTLLLPWLNVNKKVSYKPIGKSSEYQYIIKSISHDIIGYTTTITMCRFYPLYEQLLKEAGTHKTLSEYTHGYLSRYTHEELVTVISGEEDY